MTRRDVHDRAAENIEENKKVAKGKRLLNLKNAKGEKKPRSEQAVWAVRMAHTIVTS